MTTAWDDIAWRPDRDRRPAGPQRLTVLYDENCRLCRRAHHWLTSEPTHIPLELIAAGSSAAISRYGDLGGAGRELVVVDDEGHAWIGPGAFLVAMWATRRWRAWSYRMSSRTLAPLAERFFRLVSAHRGRIGAVLREPDCSWCDRPPPRVAAPPPPPPPPPSGRAQR